LNSNDAQSEVLKELLSLRQQIDRLDHALVLLLANRFALTQKVGELKASAGLNCRSLAPHIVPVAAPRHRVPDREHMCLVQLQRWSAA
jgi:chorismate mutase